MVAGAEAGICFSAVARIRAADSVAESPAAAALVGTDDAVLIALCAFWFDWAVVSGVQEALLPLAPAVVFAG